MSENHIFYIILALMMIYLLWMDLALYFKLQSGYEEFLVVQNYKNLNHTESASASGANLPHYDPFNPLSVKLLMLDHLNHYIYYPLCWWIDTYFLHISDRLLFITPDMISLSHVFLAAIGARCLLSESLSQRRCGVILFQIRTMLDSYDGMVARARANTIGLSQVSGSWGYWMDGICDAIGTVFFLVASWILLRKKLHRKGLNSNNNIHMLYSSPADEEPLLLESGQAVTPMKLHHSSGGVSSSSSSSSGGGGSPLSSKPAVHLNLATVTILCLLMQEFFGSFFWNRYMVNYHDLLELPVSTSIEAYQVNTLKSSTFWIISWLWKLLNPHSHMTVLLTFIFFDKTVVGFTSLRYLGFIPLAALVLSSETHLQTVAWQLKMVQSVR